MKVIRMQFRIADTFTDSLARLTGDEQKTTAFDLQLNPANPGLQFHKLNRAKDRNFWSVRVSADIRLIVHRTDDSLLLCYANHHDKAYDWAERRRLETHPKTGAAQLVELRETVQNIIVPLVTQQAPATAKREPLFAHLTDEDLLACGVPVDWLADVRGADEDRLLSIAEHLPAEASESLLALATGGRPVERRQLPAAATAVPDLPAAMDHPDAQRRFRVITSVEELERALNFPWDKWTVFLHPEQQQLVDRHFDGPVRVSGSAGTGKTIVALHRAAHLARGNEEARVLLATFSDTLAHALQTRLRRLVSNEPRLADRIDVASLDAVALRLHRALCGPISLVSPEQLREHLQMAAHAISGHKFGLTFVRTEWEQVVDAWQLRRWEEYRDFVRLGRKTRLSEAQRTSLWSIFEFARTSLAGQKLATRAEMYAALAAGLPRQRHKPYDFAVIDEAQDLNPAQLRFLAALGANRPNSLFFAGDLGQRIFQSPFSWKSCGVDIRGRSRTLRVNYRTSHQIRQHADRLLGAEIRDVDGETETRAGTVSVFNGPPPVIRAFDSGPAESTAVGEWLKQQLADGVAPHECAIFVRSEAQLVRAHAAAEVAGLPVKVLDEHVETTGGYGSICTMHLAKGLEFRAVAVMACDDEVLPLQSRIESAAEGSDLEEVYSTERQLLYVACTRARDALLVTGTKPASEFLDDMGYKDT
jgi:hypothetical protein